MKLIDYDKLFNKSLESWLKENRAKYDTPDKLECAIEDVYFEWLEKNKGSFDNNSAIELIEYFVAYSESSISIPDILCDAITARKDTAELLFATISNRHLSNEATMLVTNMLMQMQSELGASTYIDWILAGDKEDELADIATEALIGMKNPPRGDIKNAFKAAQSEHAKERLADIISYYEGDEEVFNLLSALFEEKPEAMTSIWLARLNDVRALDILKKELRNPEIDYLNYIEIKNSIESLGEIVEINRDFSGDKYFEKMKDWENNESNNN